MCREIRDEKCVEMKRKFNESLTSILFVCTARKMCRESRHVCAQIQRKFKYVSIFSAKSMRNAILFLLNRKINAKCAL